MDDRWHGGGGGNGGRGDRPAGDDALPRGTGRLMMLVIVVGLLTFWQLVFPFNFESPKTSPFLAERELHKINTVANVVLFVPYAALAAWMLTRFWPRRLGFIAGLVIVDVLLLSLIGETLQQWLPKRTSSAIDLTANTVGGAIGATLGLAWRHRFERWWRRIGDFFAERPRARTAAVVLLLVLIARWAPFDVSPETRYLKSQLMFKTLESGPPFFATRELWAAQREQRAPVKLEASFARGVYTKPATWAEARAKARAEQWRAAASFALFAVLTATVVRAFREDRMRRGWPVGGTFAALGFCLAVVVVTEFGQLFVRSRVMDATDALAAAAGLLPGLLASWLPARLWRGGSPASR